MNLVKRRLRAVGDGGMEVIGPSPIGARARTVALDDAEWIARVAAEFLRSVPSPMNHLLRHPDDASMARDPATAAGALLERADVDFVTLGELSAALRVSLVSVYRLVRRRALPVYHVGRRVLVRRSDVLAYLARHRVGPARPLSLCPSESTRAVGGSTSRTRESDSANAAP